MALKGSFYCILYSVCSGEVQPAAPACVHGPVHVQHAMYLLHLFFLFFVLNSYTSTDPLDAPVLTVPVCLSDDQFNVMFIKLTWDPVDCAQEYSLDISGMEQFSTIEESYNQSYNIHATNVSVSLVAVGGDELQRDLECSCTCDPDKTTSPGWFSIVDCACIVYVHICISCGSFVHCVHVGTSIQVGGDACFDVTLTEISCGSNTEIGYTITFIVSLME